LVTEFTEVRAHVPSELVEAAVNLALAHGVDAVVALGGGSAVGLGKAVGYRAEIPLIAIPTTYSGSEMTAVMGITDAVRGEKRTVSDPKIMARVVLYDPLVTLALPPTTTASTGVNALAHCVEAVYSPSAPPFVPPVALEAISGIRTSLPRCVAVGSDLAARTDMLRASFLAGFSLANAGMGVHHGLCHSLGGKFGVPHGIANAIVLPHAMRYNAGAVAPELASIGRAMGAAPSEDPSDVVFAFVRSLGLPQRLRDLGLGEDDLEVVAADALTSRAVAANPRPIRTREELLGILRSAW
jgi:alcohol dehydrogenase class IV